MRRLLITTAAVLAAVFFSLLATIPPGPAAAAGAVDPGVAARTLAGAYHVHTSRSDGAEDPASIAWAASKAGLRFVIFTDHGDATRPPDPPVYRGSVLCIDAVEISTTGGHYVALGMPAAPYPLGGEASAVVEDVARLGGIGFAAHPDSPKPELAWSAWDVPFDGIEWLSADTEWRNESRARLARVLFDYFVRPAAALASVLDRPDGTLARWDAAAAQRPVIALGALDAHGGVRRRVEGGSRMTVAGVPSYEASFRSFSIRVVLEEPPSGRADSDGPLVIDAIRRGRAYTAIDAIAGPSYLDFHAGSTMADGVTMGGASRDSSTAFTAAATIPDGGSLVLLRNGVEVARQAGGQLRARASGPGAYRVEVHAPREPGSPPVPWVVSNPIFVNLPSPRPSSPPSVSTAHDLRDCEWHVEKDPSSAATAVTEGGAVRLRYQLGSGEAGSQFAALACDLPRPLPAFTGVGFRIEARAPSRVSVQLRFGRDGERRWHHSVYADGTPRPAAADLETMVAAERDGVGRPDAGRATTLLFVVDRTHARAGSAGEFAVSGLALTGPAAGPAAPR